MRLAFTPALLALTVLTATPAFPAPLPDGAASCEIVRIPSSFRTDDVREPYYALYLYDKKHNLLGAKNIEAKELQKHYAKRLPQSDRTRNTKRVPQVIAGCSYEDLLDKSAGPTGDPWFELP